MVEIMKWIFYVVSVLLAPAPVFGAIPALYGSVSPDPDPVTQGWTTEEIVLGIDSAPPDGLIDTGNAGAVNGLPEVATVWQIHDRLVDGAHDHPGYAQTISVAEQDTLVAEGWEFAAEIRVVSNGTSGNAGFIGWGLSSSAQLANSLPRRIGFTVRVGANNAFEVVDTDGNSVTLGANSASDFHTITAIGCPGSDFYEWSIDGIRQGELRFLSQSLGGVTEGRVTFGADSPSGISSAADWRRLSLSELGEGRIIYVDQSATGGNNGSSWSDAYEHLQYALLLANYRDEIRVAQGVYTPGQHRVDTFRLRRCVTLLGGFPPGGGSLSARDSNPATNATILSGDLGVAGDRADNAYHVITNAASSDENTVVDGFVISGGNANGVAESDQLGGGLTSAGSAVFRNCAFRENHAGLHGGAVYTVAGLQFANCLFEGNFAGENGGAVSDSGGCHFVNGAFQGNAAGKEGGAIRRSLSPGNFSLTNCSFQGNDAGVAGGAVFLAPAPTPRFLTNCLMWNNRAGGSTALATSSIEGQSIVYSHCLVENVDLTGSFNGFDGTNPANNPRFLLPIAPEESPRTGGDLRIMIGSPALNAGDNGQNAEPLDLGGSPRIQEATIDLGAFERLADTDGDGLTDSFEAANTNPLNASSLSPTADQDRDGLTAMEEFAYGYSDLVPNPDGDPVRQVIEEGGQRYQGVRYRQNWRALPFLATVVQRSTDMGIADDWSSGETQIVLVRHTGQNPGVEDVVERSLVAVDGQEREFLQVVVGVR